MNSKPSFPDESDLPHQQSGEASETGEAAFLRWVAVQQRETGRTQPIVKIPAGDDLAVLDWPRDVLLVGSDPVLDGVHIDLARHGPAAAGRKVMNRNLSDVAAMGGLPTAALLNVVVPRLMSSADLKALYEAADAAGRRFGCPIVGGDTSSWDGKLAISLTILGRSDGIGPVKRSPPRVGDTLFVTGPLGGSILGRHHTFEPRIELGRRIAGECDVSAMLDLSDGLARDLPRLLGDDLGATLEAQNLPIHEDARRLSQETAKPALWHALNDGEDYELLFAASACDLPGVVAIGRVEPERAARLRREEGTIEPLPAGGWNHAFGE